MEILVTIRIWVAEIAAFFDQRRTQGKKFSQFIRRARKLRMKRLDCSSRMKATSGVGIASGRAVLNSAMYNKLFAKILDSSIWLEPTATRLVWLTLIASMDEDGFAQFASIGNLAHRAVIPLEDTRAAVECLQSPDADSSDPEHEGRRIEKVPGGWIVLNAPKYRDIVSRLVAKEGNRRRIQRFRDKEVQRKAQNAGHSGKKNGKPKRGRPESLPQPNPPRVTHEVDCQCGVCQGIRVEGALDSPNGHEFI